MTLESGNVVVSPDALSDSCVSWTSISMVWVVVCPVRKVDKFFFDSAVELAYAVLGPRRVELICAVSMCVEMIVWSRYDVCDLTRITISAGYMPYSIAISRLAYILSDKSEEADVPGCDLSCKSRWFRQMQSYTSPSRPRRLFQRQLWRTPAMTECFSLQIKSQFDAPTDHRKNSRPDSMRSSIIFSVRVLLLDPLKLLLISFR